MRVNQTPEAVEASPVDGIGVHWFDPKNLRRHWKAVKTRGAMLPCHETDVNAPLYGGKYLRNENVEPRICVGVSILAHREILGFMTAGTNYTHYRENGGKFTLLALAAWASRFNYAGALFDLGGRSFTMPAVDDDDRVALPGGVR
jgi:hypothetical protein